MTPWIAFFVLILLQLVLLYCFVLWHRTPQRVAMHIIFKGMLLGLFFGPAFDIAFAVYVGMFHYYIPIDIVFLICNGVLSYGLMIANVMLVIHARKDEVFHPKHAWGWYWVFILMGIVYEVINFFAPVWYWTLYGSPSFWMTEFLITVFAYPALAYLMWGTYVFLYQTTLHGVKE